jgi:acetylornithine deacetylase/succinyl-diaminopimelate desuccinylase-like protein
MAMQSMANPNVSDQPALAAVSLFEKNFGHHLEDLKTLAKIPSVSFDGFPAEEVRRSAEAVAALLKKRGLEKVEILEVPGAHPYVYGEWLKAPGKPTVLLYAHHDVQPPGREELWNTPPFTPTEKEGPGGLRLFGRGTADDKAGVVVHTAAIASYLEAVGSLPLNVKVVIEGEEEVGSTHLEKFLETYRSKLNADVLILTDTSNFDCGKPALTVALRGLVGVEVEVRALSKAVHSGMWGGPVPDPVMALSKMLATLVDADGRIAIPGVREQVKPLGAEEEARLKLIPFEEAAFREQSGMVPGSKLLREGPNPIAQLWRFPSLTVTATQASSRKQAGNIINDTAWAKVTIRLVADMDPIQCTELLKAQLKKSCPWGLEVKFLNDSHGAPAWSIDPKGVAFDAAIRSMKKGYGVEPLMMGCGGSIPFVGPFARALGGAPALLVGVEDPYTNAHGENESLLISDLKKACLSQIYLFEDLAKNFKGK